MESRISSPKRFVITGLLLAVGRQVIAGGRRGDANFEPADPEERVVVAVEEVDVLQFELGLEDRARHEDDRRGSGRGLDRRLGGIAVRLVGPNLDGGALAAGGQFVVRGHHFGQAGQARRARGGDLRPPRQSVRRDARVRDPALDLRRDVGRRDGRRGPVVAEPVVDDPPPLVLGDRSLDDGQKQSWRRGNNLSLVIWFLCPAPLRA